MTSHDPSHDESHEVRSKLHNGEKATPTDDEQLFDTTDNNSMFYLYMYWKGALTEDVSLLERCPHFRGWYVQASMELGPEDESLLERRPHFRGWYVQASM